MPRGAIATKSWKDHGAILLVSDLMKETPPLVNALAPEHLELSCAAAEDMLPSIRNAGAIFIGHYTPEAVGDYVAGSTTSCQPRAPRGSLPGRRARFHEAHIALEAQPRQPRGARPSDNDAGGGGGTHGHRLSVAIRLSGAV